ncbi:FitA-like ribbon-helix-helix domain-containing protein [Geodermatophilus amargosae]|uniref:FitA-like ribbon-helix-helix domain-containing protein n=1 Tax=Geodermatophilus amargosae TaxID=1296565 RepID=UPI0034DED8EA
MPVSITIPDVPDETHAVLLARATRAGQSLQHYVRDRLVESASRSSHEPFWNRVQHRVASTGSRLPAPEITDLRGEDLR